MKTKITYLVQALVLGFLICNKCIANNIQIANTGITSVNSGSQYAMVQFDINWENSWRDITNWDAAWVFIKYRTTGSTGAWQHATLNYVNGTSDGHLAPAGSAINTPSDGKGIFIFRNSTGTGNAIFAGTQLRWNFGVDGLTSTSTVDIKVFAIEMVYVPQGSFYVGDGETTNIYGNFENGISGTPLQITSENLLTLGGGSTGSLGNNNGVNMYVNPGCTDGCLPGSGDDFSNTTPKTLAATFPKGFNAFYCMKYEMTQQQLVDMLNCCTVIQQSFLTDTTNYYPNLVTAKTKRWGITSSGNVYSTSEIFTPIIYFDWIRAAAYADWAGLRPMTELEFEKACRGTSIPVVSEYPWGNANIDLSANLTLANQGLTNEAVASGYNSGGTNGNCWINGSLHNMSIVARVGIFSANVSNAGRITAGASYYGIMDLGGNAWERAVSVGNPESRKFTGNHGDGVIDINGYANVVNWPGSFSLSIVNKNIGVGYRGGGLAYPSPNIERNARISNRRLASGYYDAVIHDDGARFIRTAP